MFQIISLIVLIIAVFHTISVRNNVKKGTVVDELVGGEKVYVWISSLLNPIFSGAVFYYGWRKILPNKAKKANSISLWSFLIIIILLVINFIISPK